MKTHYGSISAQEKRNFTPRALGCDASQVFKARSGRFVHLDAVTGLIKAVSDGTNFIDGAIESEDIITSSVAGVTKLAVDLSTDTIYEVPLFHAGGAQTEGQLIVLLGKTCDVKVTANVQYADIATQIDKVLQIVDFDVAEQTVYVKINSAKQMQD